MPFNPQRLELARKRRGFTKVQLKDSLEVSLRILVAYERGEKEPSSLTLTRLSQTLDFPPDFFAGSDMDEPLVETSSFRALTSLSARHRDQALGAGALALALSDWIDDRFTLPAPAVPQLSGVDPETAAMAVRSRWNLGEKSVRNSIHLLEAHGVRVFSLVEECRQLDAFSFWRRDLPYVFLDTTKTAERSRMNAAHELGHLVMHWEKGPRGREAEFEADIFASAFLMPRGTVIAEAPRGGRLKDIHEAKRRWGVSAAALIYRMRKLGLLTEWQARSLFIELSSEGGRREEKDGGKPESSQMLAQVFDALRASGVSKKDVASALTISPSELDKMIFGLVFTSLEGSGLGSSSRSGRPNLRVV